MSGPTRNVLFIMADQLRWDYLSCAAPDRVATPNIDALAARGVRFDRAYVQSPICGPSRMSTYTGTYMRTHGTTWNDVPLRVDEWTLGDYLRPLGMRTQLVGKTHMRADIEAIERLGIDRNSETGKLLIECGFEAFERDDGLHPESPGVPPERFTQLRYNQYLNALGYDGPNPWHTWANSWEDKDGTIRSGWLLDAGPHPARVAAEHSETPYMTRRAIECIEQSAGAPWCIHLSFIKPHWPYIAPAPYHALYGPDNVPRAVRSEGERQTHPVLDAFQQLRYSQSFARDNVRRAVIPAYMGLIKQIDDELGKLFVYLETRALLDSTMIVFTSDHGDFLGDHWLGEKDFFHEPSARVPLIVVDPRPAADSTRGTVSKALVEQIDLAPTFIEYAGGTPAYHRLQGRALTPLLHGATPQDWRDSAFSEFDYAINGVRGILGTPIDRSKMQMVVTDRWKLMAFDGYPPMAFDLHDDPNELHDRGTDPGAAAAVADLRDRLDDWAERVRRPTESVASLEARTGTQTARGILIGIVDEAGLAAAKEQAHG
jgi:arylsulfatase A-like enzyme